MSSILDALNKLEREQALAEQDADDAEVSAEVARQDLVGESLWHDRRTVRLSPAVLAAGLTVFALIFVVVSVLVSLMLMGQGSTAPEVAASRPPEVNPSLEPPLPPASTSSSPQEALAVEEEESGKDRQLEPAGSPAPKTNPTKALQGTAAPIPTPASPTVADPGPPIQPEPSARLTGTQRDRKPLPVKPAPAQPPAVTQEDEPDRAAPTPVQRTSNPEASIAPAAMKAPPAVNAPQPSSTRPPASSPAKGLKPATSLAAAQGPARIPRARKPAEEPPAPRSIRSLPILSPGVQSRYGIENLKVNMVGPATDTNPYGWALINRLKVFEGEPIQDTHARLFQVESYGIAIEITSTGERYFKAF